MAFAYKTTNVTTNVVWRSDFDLVNAKTPDHHDSVDPQKPKHDLSIKL